MVAWLEHAECQLQAVDQVFFSVFPALNATVANLWTQFPRSPIPRKLLQEVVPR